MRPLAVVKPDEALAIGILYRKARGSVLDSVRYLIEAGTELAQKKKSLPHGSWLPWLAENEDALGFGEYTARRLIKVATNRALAPDLDETSALQISRQLWSHTPKPPKPQRDDDLPPDYEGSADPDDSAAEMKAKFATADKSEANEINEDMPTQEEADESYQQTIYDHVCQSVDEEMSGKTRQRFFAHLRRKYHVNFTQSSAQRGDKGLPA